MTLDSLARWELLPESPGLGLESLWNFISQIPPWLWDVPEPPSLMEFAELEFPGNLGWREVPLAGWDELI